MLTLAKFMHLLCGITAACALALSTATAAETICARVEIQIAQEMTLEREGFEARLGIVNGLPSDLTNLQVNLRFFDANGSPVVAETVDTIDSPSANSKFFHRLQTGYEQPINVLAGVAVKVAYFIVPMPGAAGDSAEGSRYAVGATIKYTTAGREEIIELTPDEITVRPMPMLQLQYFLPGDVFGDDPLTDEAEPVVPFLLGVRVANRSSHATASRVKIQSGQPEIIDNQEGLLVDFRIIGSTVNGAPTQPTLLTDFGSIAPKRAGMAAWRMTTSLSGKFVAFTAKASHSVEFGGALTSLIPEEGTETRRLLGQVMVDLPGRDTIPDFLATSEMTGDDYSAVTLHESDDDEEFAAVSYYPPGAAGVSLYPNGAGGYQLTLLTAADRGYARVAFSGPMNREIRAVRSDGKVLPAANAWISGTRDPLSGEISHWLNLFDTGINAGQVYTLTLAAPPANHVPVLTLAPASLRVRFGQRITIIATATDADGTHTKLSTGTLPDGATFTDASNGTGSLVWTPAAEQIGVYPVLIRATDGANTVSRIATITVSDAFASGYDAWANIYWPGLTGPAGSDADPDRDGLDNLLEYALGANPTVADEAALPAIGLVKIDGESYLTLTYRHRTDDPALEFEVVASDALYAPMADWSLQTTVIEAGDPDPQTGLRQVTVRDSVSTEDGGSRRYLRLRVTRDQTP
jgi:hypothetical protein